jgi:hypothetical protein
MDLILLPDTLSICRLHKDAPVPQWALSASFYSMVRTEEELSIVCPEGHPPADIETNAGWRALKVRGPLGFEETGVLAGLAAPLAEAGISVFAISTFNTDYLLLRKADLTKAIRVLSPAHAIHT